MKDTPRHIVDRDTRHFVQIYHDLIESDRFRDLSPAAFKVYTVLKFRAMGKENCIPSKKRIATDAGMAERTVTNAINELIEMGLIVRHERKRADGSFSSNEYTIQGTLQDSYPGVVSNPAPHEQDKEEQDISSTTVDESDAQIVDEQSDRESSGPPRDFLEPVEMKPFDVQGWWYEMMGIPLPKGAVGKDLRAGKELLRLGFNTSKKLNDLWSWVDSDPFWHRRGVTLMEMANRAQGYLTVHREMRIVQDANALRLARLKRRDFHGTMEHARYMQFNGEQNLAHDIALLEQQIHDEQGADPSA